jgi:ABC-type transport system involved in cytochrome bd biosynthesis fused ATPase/permease subunit
MMGHDWIFEVLKDLRSYALSNDLPALAAKAEDALRVAEVEIAAKVREGSDGAQSGGAHNQRRH